MSRTYRKRNHFQRRQNTICKIKYGHCIERPKTKADISFERSDNGPWRHPQAKWWMKQVSRLSRQVNREQFSKLRKTSDIEDFDFDDSKYVKFKKGIWWEIY